MKPPLPTLALSIFLAVLPLSASAQTFPPASPSPAASSPTILSNPASEKKIEALLHQMTLEEKVGQLVQYSAGQPTGPGTGRSDFEEMIRKGEIGSLININTARDTNKFQRIALEQSRLRIPILFGLDVIHGFRTEFPIPLGLASSWSPELIEQTARVAAQESSASGVRWTFSPMVDISRDARWGRIIESSGEDPFLGSALARAYVRGYQTARLDAPDSVASCPKHFVGYGAAEAGRDYNPVDISEHALRQTYLPPFRAAVDQGAATIMSAFNSLNGVPASANAFTLKKILEGEWHFQGFVDSDWNSVGELIPHGVANDGAAAARKGFLGGVDMDMASSVYHDHLVKLVHDGAVPESAVDEAVRRVLRIKFALGLFDRPYADEAKEAAAMLRPESVALARTAAERSFVLLKNQAAGASPLLPIPQQIKSIALIGPQADDPQNMLGSWTGQGRATDAVTLRAALSQKIGAGNLHYAKGCEFLGGTDDQIADAVAVARQSDLAILALGENAPEMTGEAASRAFLGLPGRQQELLEKIVATGKPVVLIIFSGRPLTLPWAFEHVPAVLAAWFPGIQAGPALADILFGQANFSGKLVVSWPRNVGQEPLHYDSMSTGRPARNVDLSHPPQNAREKYLSRYIDEQNSPQFPFGFGLSYSEFRYANLKLDRTTLSANALNEKLAARDSSSALTVTAEITNAGNRQGDEIVQLYLNLRGTSVVQPVRILIGFQHLSLAPGETKTVSFPLGPETFAFWNEDNRFPAEPAAGTLWAAPDSAHGISANFEITQ